MNEEEIWKDTKGYERLYQVSNFGRIRNIKFNRIRKLGKNRYGYPMVNLYYKGVSKNISVHRIVAMAFIPNPKNYPQVNHIDGNKLNNNVNNLEWCTAQYNIEYSYKKLGRKGYSNNGKYTGSTNWNAKKVKQYDLDGNFIKEWGSQVEARKKLNIADGLISNCCKGKRLSAGGYIWKYA